MFLVLTLTGVPNICQTPQTVGVTIVTSEHALTTRHHLQLNEEDTRVPTPAMIWHPSSLIKTTTVLSKLIPPPRCGRFPSYSSLVLVVVGDNDDDGPKRWARWKNERRARPTHTYRHKCTDGRHRRCVVVVYTV